MIQAKKKLCSVCGNLEYLFRSNPPTCSKCVKKKPINKVSDKHKETLKEYKPLREEFLKQNPNCQLKLQGCLGIASEIEHREGKSSKELYLNSSKWFAICRVCHHQLEFVLGEKAYEKGFKLHRNQITE